MPETFELEFRRAGGGAAALESEVRPTRYQVRRADATTKEVVIPWDELIVDLAELRNPRRDPAVLGRVGERLREVLEAAGWETIERAVQDAIARRTRVHVVIRSEAPEIYALPWEILSLKASKEALGSARGVLVRYQGLPLTRWSPESGARRGRGRILIATSAAGGGVPSAEHIEVIGAALLDAGGGSPEVLSSATLDSIEEALNQAKESGEPFECLHLLCHGVQRGSAYGLALSDADIEPMHLQRRLAPFAGTLRLVVVAACDSANVGLVGAAVTSVTDLLHRLGIGAVIGSRFPLSVDGSTKMTEALYRAILVGRKEIEEAFIAAREALLDPKFDEWATLQLLWRGDDLQLWRFWSSPRDVEADLRAILTGSDGAKALAEILARPGYLATDPHTDDPLTALSQALVRAATSCAELGEAFRHLELAVAQLGGEQRPLLLSGLAAACDIVEVLAPSAQPEEVMGRSEGGFLQVETLSKAALDILVACEGGHRSFLELKGGELVGRGRIEEPAYGAALQRGPSAIAEKFVTCLAEEIGLPSDPKRYGGIDRLAGVVDAQLDRFTARTPEGTPGRRFCPRYVDIDADGGKALAPDVRAEIARLLKRVQMVARRAQWSALDEALLTVQSLFEDREK